MKPMLARPIDVDPERLHASPEWVAEWKADGKRALVATGDRLTVVSRKGDPTDLPRSVSVELNALDPGFTLDGEVVGDRFVVFDLLTTPPSSTGKPLADPTMPWAKRRIQLENLLSVWQPAHIEPITLATTARTKRALEKRLRKSGHEGIVWKRADSAYAPGQRSACWLKQKFVKTITCLVIDFGLDGKDNVELGVFAGGSVTSIGTASRFEGDGPLLQLGDTVDVRYLNPGREDAPRLFQAHLGRRRPEKRAAECTIEQIALWVNKSIPC